MNRRELAKNGFFGLCGALLGKLFPSGYPKRGLAGADICRIRDDWKAKEANTLQLTCGTDSDVTCHVSFPPGSVNTWGGWDFLKADDGYSLSDGTEIEHGIN